MHISEEYWFHSNSSVIPRLHQRDKKGRQYGEIFSNDFTNPRVKRHNIHINQGDYDDVIFQYAKDQDDDPPDKSNFYILIRIQLQKKLKS